nr:uncharacterized protein LOC123748724 [Procambarus clarkii]
MTSEKRYAVVGFNDRSVGIISTTWIEKSDDEKILCWWPQSRHTVSAQKHEKPDTTNWRVHVVSTILSTTDDFDVAKRRCLAAEDTSNVETEDDMGYPRQRKGNHASNMKKRIPRITNAIITRLNPRRLFAIFI